MNGVCGRASEGASPPDPLSEKERGNRASVKESELDGH